jgi:SAM-dependent methyltransferase
MPPYGRDPSWISEEFDSRAGTYDESAMHRWQAEKATTVLQPEPGQRILDIASGTGLAARACETITGEPENIVGIDISLGMLKAARRQSSSHYLMADAERLPFANRVFDAIICVAAVPYLPDLAAAVVDWRRVSRRGGRLVFTTPAAGGVTEHRLIRQAAARHGFDFPDPHADLGSVEAIQRHAGQLNLRIDRVTEHRFPVQLGSDPRGAFDSALADGFAELLRTAPRQQQEEIYTSFSVAYLTTTHAEHRVMFTRCRF